MRKTMVLLDGEDVAPRFDLCAEVWIGYVDTYHHIKEDRVLVLPRASADELCQLIVNEDIQTVICGAIESDYYEYLRWKKIEVLDSIIASYITAIKAYANGELAADKHFIERT